MLLLQDLYEKDPQTFVKPIINGMLEFQWNEFLNARKRVSKYFHHLFLISPYTHATLSQLRSPDVLKTDARAH